ncbi:MAG: NAD(P)-binding domain-containing protein [Pseudomonadota bacterium]
MQIGIAGCGRMGAPMLENLRNAGFDAIGYDVRPMADFADLNAPITQDKSAFAIHTEVLLTVVRDQAQTEDVLFRAQGFSYAPNLEAIIICSTLEADYIDSLRARIPAEIALIDAPMSGASVAAQERRLSFMIGSTEGAITKYAPVFQTLGKDFHYLGAYGAGMKAKLFNNLLAASSISMTRLVHDWAQDAGMDWEALRDVIASSSGQNWFASNFDRIEFAKDGFGNRNSMGILKKDIEAALDALPDDARTDLPKSLIKVIENLKEI